MNYAIQQYIMKHGKQYQPATCPEYIKRGEVGDCFDTCVLNLLTNKHLRYIEGLAAHPFEENVWILHSWLTDEKGEVAYDPTWMNNYNGEALPVLTIYMGIEIPTDTLLKFMRTTEYKSIMANGWRNREIADTVLPDFPYKKAMQ